MTKEFNKFMGEMDFIHDEKEALSWARGAIIEWFDGYDASLATALSFYVMYALRKEREERTVEDVIKFMLSTDENKRTVVGGLGGLIKHIYMDMYDANERREIDRKLAQRLLEVYA